MSDHVIVVVVVVQLLALGVVGGELPDDELDGVANDGKMVVFADENLAIEMEPAVAVDEMASIGQD